MPIRNPNGPVAFAALHRRDIMAAPEEGRGLSKMGWLTLTVNQRKEFFRRQLLPTPGDLEGLGDVRMHPLGPNNEFVSVYDFESPATVFYRHVTPAQDGRPEGHLACTTEQSIHHVFTLFNTRMELDIDVPETILTRRFVQQLINRGEWLRCPCSAASNGRFIAAESA